PAAAVAARARRVALASSRDGRQPALRRPRAARAPVLPRLRAARTGVRRARTPGDGRRDGPRTPLTRVPRRVSRGLDPARDAPLGRRGRARGARLPPPRERP